jgi:hypothetical protein
MESSVVVYHDRHRLYHPSPSSKKYRLFWILQAILPMHQQQQQPYEFRHRNCSRSPTATATTTTTGTAQRIRATTTTLRLLLIGLGICLGSYNLLLLASQPMASDVHHMWMYRDHNIIHTMNYHATVVTTTTKYQPQQQQHAPTFLRMGIFTYLQRLPLQFIFHETPVTVLSDDTTIPAMLQQPIKFWNIIQNYHISTAPNISRLLEKPQQQRQPSYTNSTAACIDPPGDGWEGGIGAYQLLTQKIQLYHTTTSSTTNDTTTTRNMAVVPSDHRRRRRSPLRLLCAVYTHIPMHHLVRMAALTWGVQCDGFLAFSSSTSLSSSSLNQPQNDSTTTTATSGLGIISIPHIGPESYHNMWQKTRAIWKYIYTHHIDEYDYIHLSGDDVYLLVPNLKHFLDQQEQRQLAIDSSKPVQVFAGQWIRQKNRPYVGGGPGYTISRDVLVQYMQIWDTCYPNITSSAEDRYFSLCMKYANISLTDTRDINTGEQTYHDCPPQQVYESRPVVPMSNQRRRPNFHVRAISYWETLPFPTSIVNSTNLNTTTPPISTTRIDPWRPIVDHPADVVAIAGHSENSNTTAAVPPNMVGPKYGLQAAAQYTIAFHKISHPLFMLRLHTLLYPNLCSIYL